MLLHTQALLAHLSATTGIDFTLISPDTIELSADDAFKLAAVVDLASRCAEVMGCFPDTLRETIALGSEVFPADSWATLDDTVMGQPRERVAKDLADKRSAEEQEKLVEAGRKSWVTRRANAAKVDEKIAAGRAKKPAKGGRK